MSSLEINKIAASILTAGVVAMLAGFVAELLTHSPELEENVYVVATAEPEEEAPAEPAGPEPVLPLLAAADPTAGEAATRACAACHTFEEGGPHRIGPNLYGVVGSDIASAEGFSYSPALQELEGDWTYEALNGFLASPRDYAPGTKMTYAGARSVETRADLIAYLRTLAQDPVPLPSPEEVQAAEQAAAPAEEGEAAPEDGAAGEGAGEAQQAATAGGDDLGPLLAAASAEEGAKVARKCTACHTFEEGGPHKIGPNLYGVVGGSVAHSDDYNYSDALQAKSDQTWTYENLAAWIESPNSWAPGNKMTFAGIRKAEDRADLIAYMRTQSDDPPPLPE